ncbi:MAG: hypothetical protein ABSA92_05080 [Candidatus Bathyarchaeia archaeon]
MNHARLNRAFLVTMIISIAFAALALGPVSAGGGTVAGPWRDINPTQYVSAGDSFVPGPNVPFNGVYVRQAGFGSVGAGDAWAVGGCDPSSALWPFSTSGCGGASGGGTVVWYDGFSWLIKGINGIVSPAFYSGVNFCTSPGAPSVGLCSPNGDGSDGWIVGGDATGQIAAYVTNPSSITIDKTGLNSTGYLTSVFETCHVDNDPNGKGCPSGPGDAYATGTDGTHGRIYEYTGDAPTGGGWHAMEIGPPSQLYSSTATIYNSIYMFIDSANQLEGFAVGNNGVIARYFGGQWEDTVVAPSTTTFHGVAVDDVSIDAWAVGYDSTAMQGVIYHFSSGTWAGVLSPTPVNKIVLESVFPVSQSEGWIVGTQSTILHGTNLPGSSFTAIGGGGSNTLVTGTGPAIDLNSVSFQSGGAGWAVGTHGVILQTSDSSCGSIVQTSSPSACWGGQTSIVQTAQLRAVYETSDSDAWAAGLFDTVNNLTSMIHWDGNKWHRANIPENVAGQGITKPDIYGIYMAGSGEGYAVGGQNTSSVPPPTCGRVSCPVAYTWNTIIQNYWQPVSVGQCANSTAGCEMRSVYFASIGPIDGWAVGTNGGIWTYSKANPGWSLYASGLPASFDANLNGVFINNPGSNSYAGWAIGDDGTILSLNCNNAPCVWTMGSIPGLPNTVNLYGIYFTDSTHGWIVGSGNTIITTTDGVNWVLGSAANAPPTTVWRSVHVDTYSTNAGSGDGWAVGYDSQGNETLAWWNGGGWTAMQIPYQVYPGLGLYSVFTTSPTDGWAVGAQPVAGMQDLTGIFHLDPVNPPIYGANAGTTTIVSTSVSGGASSTLTTTSTSASTTTTSTSTSLLTESTTSISSSLSTSTTTSVTTETSTVISSNTEQIPAIPGFPWESILAGILIGLATVGVIRRTRK